MKIEITHPEKVLFPKGKITKKELADYYSKVAKWMIPHLKDRPLSMKCYPKGIKQPGYFQKSAPKSMPKGIKTAKIQRKEKGPIDMILCNDKDTLLFLANQNCIAPHIWLSRKDKPDYPDRLVFDIDPPKGKSFDAVRDAAFQLRAILEKKYKLNTFVMLTGSKGVHVVVPLKRTRTFDQVRMFAKEVAEEMVEERPKLYTTAARKNKRRGKIYIDVMRNAKAATAVAPFAVRPIDGAPVAAPISWAELKDSKLRSNSFTIRTIQSRLRKNPWPRLGASAKTLPSLDRP